MSNKFWEFFPLRLLRFVSSFISLKRRKWKGREERVRGGTWWRDRLIRGSPS